MTLQDARDWLKQWLVGPTSREESTGYRGVVDAFWAVPEADRGPFFDGTVRLLLDGDDGEQAWALGLLFLLPMPEDRSTLIVDAYLSAPSDILRKAVGGFGFRLSGADWMRLRQQFLDAPGAYPELATPVMARDQSAPAWDAFAAAFTAVGNDVDALWSLWNASEGGDRFDDFVALATALPPATRAALAERLPRHKRAALEANTSDV